MASKQLIKPWTLPAQQTYILTHATIIDPVNGTTIPNQTVTLSKGRIASIYSSHDPATPRAPKGSISLDLSGKFLCPGLIDAHVHLSSVPGGPALKDSVVVDPTVSLTRQPFQCFQILKRGFTTVRDCGGATLALKEALRDDVIPGPRLFFAGRALSQTGGHGDFRGAHDHTECCGGAGEPPLGLICDGVTECTKAAREQLRTGADFIKIMCGGGVASPTDALENTQFTAAEVRAVCEVADSYNTWVTAHAYTVKAIRHAVDNGVRGIEHGNFVDEETARYMKEMGVWLTPTLVAYEAMRDEKKYPGFLPPESWTKNEEVLAKGLKALEIARDAGVTMCYGSDLLGPLGGEQTKEFGLRAKVLEPKLLLQSATINPAKMLRQQDFLGQIKTGFAADVLILNRNPLENIEMFDRPDKHLLAVIKDGRVHVSRWSSLPEDVTQPPPVIE